MNYFQSMTSFPHSSTSYCLLNISITVFTLSLTMFQSKPDYLHVYASKYRYKRDYIRSTVYKVTTTGIDLLHMR
jgi:hypothetical protein